MFDPINVAGEMYVLQDAARFYGLACGFLGVMLGLWLAKNS
jgi:tetrahydromethanopterin S-methyltransferase subunit F